MFGALELSVASGIVRERGNQLGLGGRTDA